MGPSCPLTSESRYPMSHLLFKAASAGDVTAIEAQLARGADIDWRHKGTGRTALIEASIQRQPQAVSALLRHGASLDLQCKALGSTALAWAASLGDAAIAAMLLAHEADIEIASPELRRTALMRAAQAGHAELVALLLEAGANPAPLDFRQENAWALARDKGHTQVMALLEKSGSASPPAPAAPQAQDWPDISPGSETQTPERVVRAYILAMEAWERKGVARRAASTSASEPEFWAEQLDIVAKYCTSKPRAYAHSSFGTPTHHAAQDLLLSVTQQSASRMELIVLRASESMAYEHRFSVHRKAGGQWRIDSLARRLHGTQKWERDIL